MSESFDITAEEAAGEQQRFMTRVYSWMTLALAVSGFVAWSVSTTPALLHIVSGHRWVFWVILFAEILLVATLVGFIKKLSASMATFVFLLYSVLNGATLSFIFLVYTAATISTAFWVTAGTFGVMSVWGYFTKRNLQGMGFFLMMLLSGLLIASVVNIFLQSEMVYWISTYAGVLIFVLLTAYDTQKIREMNIIGNEGTEEDRKEAITGALALYLDFVNLFLFFLRIFGRRD